MAEFGIGIFVGLLCGLFFKQPVEKRVLETESAAVERIRSELMADIERVEARLLSSRCGWSEADDLRNERSIYREILKMLPEPRS